MKKKKLRLKPKVKIFGIIMMIVGIMFITTGTIITTYARYSDNKAIQVKTTTGDINVSASLENTGNSFSSDGYAYFRIIIKNYDENNVLTKVPASCTLTVSSEEEKGLYRYVDATGYGIDEFVSNFTTKEYKFDIDGETEQNIRIEVKNETGEQEILDMKAVVNCKQVIGE